MPELDESIQTKEGAGAHESPEQEAGGEPQFTDGIGQAIPDDDSTKTPQAGVQEQSSSPPQAAEPPFPNQFQPFPPYRYPQPVPWPVPVPTPQPQQDEQWSWEKALTEPGYVERFVSRAVERERAQLQLALAQMKEEIENQRFSTGIKQAEPVIASFVRENFHELRDPRVFDAFRSSLVNMAYIAAEHGDASPFSKREMYAALLAMAKEQVARDTPRSVHGRTAEVLDQRRGQASGHEVAAVQIEPWEEQLMREWGISREDWIKNKLGK